SRPDALLHDPNEAAARVVRMLREGVVRAVDGSDVLVEAETICVHGDTPDAVAFARSLRERLEREGITVSAPKIETKSAWSRRALAPTERRIIADRPEGGPAPFSAGPASFRNGPARNRRAPLGRAGFGHLTHLPSFYENSIVFFTTCAYGRRKILAASQCHGILRRLWERSAVRDGWWVGHYILMPDHVHFFARAGNEARSIASWVQMWKSVASRQIAAAFGIDPPIWQPEYFDRYLRSTESYSEKWHYVERNPLRGGLVKRVEEWPYRGTIHDLRF
ncbi:MAG: LamB/YcsF family protein, partial [Chthoniobacterales bacterium]